MMRRRDIDPQEAQQTLEMTEANLSKAEGAENPSLSWLCSLESTHLRGWHSLKVKGEVQTRKGLRWIPRHEATRKGVISDEMLRGVENKRRSRDS
ncbi:hypothetical protein L484_000835 [Morus notabilis]|uniref:Uncharacterized protein n=1 Tax=Morus notabilis TaxID=981085 RepID=W9T1F2_9ROSA|nr:hypothetical protein L484_000835 [Morus notabilis]